MTSIHVAIVNYRTGELVVDCLQSLSTMISELRGGRVVVVDNNSEDGSLARIRSAIRDRGWSPWVELLPLPRNGGFAYGNNAVLRRVREIDPGFAALLLLNPDTIASPGMIGQLVGHLEVHTSVGIVGAAIEDAAGVAQLSAHRLPSPLMELDGGAQLGMLSRCLTSAPWNRVPSRVPHECDWVSGACMAVRREVFDAIGPMDEGYFLYFEEVDFCLRARRAGWRCWFVPTAHVQHLEGAATGIRAPRRRRPGYWYQSRRRFFVKAYGIVGLLAADALWALGRLSLIVRRALGLGGRAGLAAEPERLAWDLLAGDLKAIVRGELHQVPRIL